MSTAMGHCLKKKLSAYFARSLLACHTAIASTSAIVISSPKTSCSTQGATSNWQTLVWLPCSPLIDGSILPAAALTMQLQRSYMGGSIVVIGPTYGALASFSSQCSTAFYLSMVAI